eukprot:Pgem_evm1s5807
MINNNENTSQQQRQHLQLQHDLQKKELRLKHESKLQDLQEDSGIPEFELKKEKVIKRVNELYESDIQELVKQQEIEKKELENKLLFLIEIEYEELKIRNQSLLIELNKVKHKEKNKIIRDAQDLKVKTTVIQTQLERIEVLKNENEKLNQKLLQQNLQIQQSKNELANLNRKLLKQNLKLQQSEQKTVDLENKLNLLQNHSQIEQQDINNNTVTKLILPLCIAMIIIFPIKMLMR